RSAGLCRVRLPAHAIRIFFAVACRCEHGFLLEVGAKGARPTDGTRQAPKRGHGNRWRGSRTGTPKSATPIMRRLEAFGGVQNTEMLGIAFRLSWAGRPMSPVFGSRR